jgi:hypothetical protein
MLVSRPRWSILWGGNYFGLEPTRCWLVWDKDNGRSHYADCEPAWTNPDKAVRKIKHRWNGMLQTCRRSTPTSQPWGEESRTPLSRGDRIRDRHINGMVLSTHTHDDQHCKLPERRDSRWIRRG